MSRNRDPITLWEIIDFLVAQTAIAPAAVGSLSKEAQQLIADIKGQTVDEITTPQPLPKHIQVTSQPWRNRHLRLLMKNTSANFYRTTALFFMFECAALPARVINAKVVSFSNGVLVLDPHLDGGGISKNETDIITLLFSAVTEHKFLGVMPQ